MTKTKQQFWVLVSRIEINEIQQIFIYGDEFPNLKDKPRLERLQKAGLIGTSRPTDIPEPPVPEINYFEPSQPWVAPEKPAKPKAGQGE